MIGRRLRRARYAAGLSLNELEKWIGGIATAHSLGKRERDDSAPSSQSLLAMVQVIGVSAIYPAGDQELALDGVELHKRGISGNRDIARVEAAVWDRLERYLAVEEALELPSVEWNRHREAPYPVGSLPEAARAASNLRRHWDPGVDPIADLVALLEENGIKAAFVDSGKVDGLAARIRRPRMRDVQVIAVDRNPRCGRHRFTLSHEVGRMVMDISPGVSREEAANRFAGAADLRRAGPVSRQ